MMQKVDLRNIVVLSFCMNVFSDYLNDKDFIPWLAKKLSMKTIRLRKIINAYLNQHSSSEGRKQTEEKELIHKYWKR